MAFASVASTTTSTALLGVDTSRSAVLIANTDTNRLYVLLGSDTASASNHSFSLAENENALLNGYDGPISGVWAGDGSGSAMVTTW